MPAIFRSATRRPGIDSPFSNCVQMPSSFAGSGRDRSMAMDRYYRCMGASLRETAGMARTYDRIEPAVAEWIARQHVFFVASAPLAADGRVNLSPKGYDSLRLLGPNRVAYEDLTGSGAETIAHAKENGRITLMLCAFEGPPRIVRLFGTATVRAADD